VDDVRARLDHRVAEAVEAWLADPRDAAVYARLVTAVAERRTALDVAHAEHGGAAPAGAGPEEVGLAEVGLAEVGPAEVGPAEVGPAEVGPDDDSPGPPMRPVGADRVGDPRAVLERLRRT
jgi:hypothetical protein